jgi:hypothetical protein
VVGRIIFYRFQGRESLRHPILSPALPCGGAERLGGSTQVPQLKLVRQLSEKPENLVNLRVAGLVLSS